MSPPSIKSNFVKADGIDTHYLEAGTGYPLVLLHSGEFGGCSELSWEFMIPRLAEHFRVLAPDWLGFGKTAKLFDFEDMRMRRVTHIAAFLQTMQIENAHFMGNSMGATILLEVAAMDDRLWPMDRIVSVGGGGAVPQNEAREILNTYDGSLEHMQRIVNVLITDPKLRADRAYIERRHRISLEPGSWECTAAARFRRSGRPPYSIPSVTYNNIKCPTLLVVGEHDRLRDPGYAKPMYAAIPDVEMQVMTKSGHCPNLDQPYELTQIVIDFLTRPR